MANLLIIGNGFDLAHGLQTSYGHFMHYLLLNDREKDGFFTGIKVDIPNDYIEFENKYDIIKDKIITQSRFVSQLIISKNHTTNWSDIELEYQKFINECDDEDPTPHINKTNEDFDNLKNKFFDYLSKLDTEIKELNLCFIKILEETLKDKVIIVNFNYTNTIQQYISKSKIPLVEYPIHGTLGSEEYPPIFGYGHTDSTMKDIRQKTDNHVSLRHYKNDYYDYHTHWQNVKDFIKSNSKNLQIIILGHSCGLSDTKIFSNLFEADKNYKFTPFLYNRNQDFDAIRFNIRKITELENINVSSKIDCPDMPSIKDSEFESQKKLDSIMKFLKKNRQLNNGSF